RRRRRRGRCAPVGRRAGRRGRARGRFVARRDARCTGAAERGPRRCSKRGPVSRPRRAPAEQLCQAWVALRNRMGGERTRCPSPPSTTHQRAQDLRPPVSCAVSCWGRRELSQENKGRRAVARNGQETQGERVSCSLRAGCRKKAIAARTRRVSSFFRPATLTCSTKSLSFFKRSTVSAYSCPGR